MSIKKLSSLLFMLVALSGVLQAQVQTQVISPYKLDFNDSISTASHDFAPAEGWSHLIDCYSSLGVDYYVDYTYQPHSGIDSTGALFCGVQNDLGNHNIGVSGQATDLLVTPFLKGKASIYVKKLPNKWRAGIIKFYNVDRKGINYIRHLPQASDTIFVNNDSTWTKIDLPVPEQGGYIGIYASYLLIDDFTADTAEIIPTRSLAIDSLKYLPGKNHIVYADSLGNFQASMTVRVTNNGQLDIKPGEDGYALKLTNASNHNKTLAVLPITRPLAAGEQFTDTVSVTLNYADTLSTDANSIISYGDKYFVIDVQELISDTKANPGRAFVAQPYLPKIWLSDKDGVVKNGKTYSFGMVSEPVTKWVAIRNDGGAPLVISQLQVPSGFKVNFTAPHSIGAGATDTLLITFLANEAGAKGGNLVIKNNATDVTFALTGSVFDASRQYITFDDKALPALWTEVPAAGAWKVSNFSSPTNNFAYNIATPSKLVSRLLKVEDGEKLSIDVACDSSDIKDDRALGIYYSTDGSNWTLARTITQDEVGSTNYVATLNHGRTSTQKFKTFIVDAIPAGDCFLAFEAGYMAIDNIYGFQPVAVLSGKVLTVDDEPVSGATLTLTPAKAASAASKASAAVLSTESAADGSYKFEIMQPAASYDAVVTAKNYKPATLTISTGNGLVQQDVVLEAEDPTGVTDAAAARQVARVTYFNLAGQQSAKPFAGVNLVRTTFTDGTTATAKVIK